MGNEAIIERAKQALLQNYKQQPVVLVRGEGVYVWDADGKRYLDLLGGIATCALGHCHPKVVEAAKRQMETLWHCSNVFYSEPQIALAERLTQASGLPGARAFFCNSGAEANEALLKLARRHQQPSATRRSAFDNSFHGRTLATVTATGQPKYQAGFEPLMPGFKHVPYGDLAAVEKAVGPLTAAILVEPIQGEGGVRVAPEGFLKGLRRLCDEKKLLLLIDEVQTGIGPHRQGLRLPARGHSARRASRSPSRSATACPSARWSAPARRPRRCPRAPTAPPSAATWSPAPRPRSPSTSPAATRR